MRDSGTVGFRLPIANGEVVKWQFEPPLSFAYRVYARTHIVCVRMHVCLCVCTYIYVHVYSSTAFTLHTPCILLIYTQCNVAKLITLKYQ